MEACVLIKQGAIIARSDIADDIRQEIVEYAFVTVAVQVMSDTDFPVEVWAFKRDGHSYVTLGKNVSRARTLGQGDES